MKPVNRLRRFGVLAVVLTGMAFAWEAQATVLRVVVVQTSDAKAYVKELERIKGVLKRLGSNAQLRVWRTHFAGPDAGAVIVSIEYASLVVLAQDEAKAYADPEYLSLIAGLDKYRKVVSDSVYDELKP